MRTSISMDTQSKVKKNSASLNRPETIGMHPAIEKIYKSISSRGKKNQGATRARTWVTGNHVNQNPVY